MVFHNGWLLSAITGILLAGALSEVASAVDVEDKPGVLVMAIGGDASWNEGVQRAVEPLRDRYPVEIALGVAQTAAVQEAVDRLELQGVRRVAVVRLFISGDSFLQRTRCVLGLEEPSAEMLAAAAAHAVPHGSGQGGGHSPGVPLPIHSQCHFYLSTEGLAESPLLDEILVQRVRELSVDPSNESVLILAHGPGDDAENERWLAQMHLRAQAIHQLGPFRHVRCATLREDWSDRRRYAERHIRRYVEDAAADGGRVLVVPFRLAEAGPYEEVLSGLDFVGAEHGLLPHRNVTRWIRETAEACLAQADNQ